MSPPQNTKSYLVDGIYLKVLIKYLRGSILPSAYDSYLRWENFSQKKKKSATHLKIFFLLFKRSPVDCVGACKVRGTL